jgi:hypothetical protein
VLLVTFEIALVLIPFFRSMIGSWRFFASLSKLSVLLVVCVLEISRLWAYDGGFRFMIGSRRFLASPFGMT